MKYQIILYPVYRLCVCVEGEGSVGGGGGVYYFHICLAISPFVTVWS